MVCARETIARNYKYICLIILIAAMICVGMWSEIIGPTLPDLRHRTGASYEEIGRTMAIRYIGNFFSNFLAAALYDRFPEKIPLFLAFIMAIGGSATIAVPWCTNIYLMSFVLLFQGVAHGAVVNGGQTMMIRIFKKKSVGALQFMHLGFGLGNVIIGFLLRPFLSPNMPSRTKFVCVVNGSTGNYSNYSSAENSTFDDPPEAIIQSKIEYAYMIIGLYAVTVGVIVLGMQFLPKTATDTQKREVKGWKNIHPGHLTNGKPLYGVYMLICLYLYYLTYVVTASLFTKYLVVFAIDQCKDYHITQKRAALIQSSAAASLMVARFFSGFMISRRPTTYIIVCICGSIFASGLYGFLASHYEIALWVSACLLKFSFGPLFPSGTAWLNRYIRVTSSVVSIAIIGATSAAFISTWMGGLLVDRYGVIAMSQWVFGVNISILVVFLAMSLCGNMHGTRSDLLPEKQDIDIGPFSPVRQTEESDSEEREELKEKNVTQL